MKMKYTSEAQIDEINALWPEHGEAITAYVKDCLRAHTIGEAKGSALAVVAFGLGAGCYHIGKKVYRKLKNKVKTEDICEA